MTLEITSGSRRAHKKQTNKQKPCYYKVTEALIQNQMSNPLLFILWGEGLGGWGKSVQVS